MNIQDIINNADGVLKKEAAAEYSELEQALAQVAAQGYYDTLKGVKTAEASAAEQAAFKAEPKGFEAIVENAMKIVSENEMVPGQIGIAGTKQGPPLSSPGEAAPAAGGAEAAAEHMEEKAAGVRDFLTYVAAVSTGELAKMQEKVACFICSKNGCSECGMSGSLKLAKAIELNEKAEADAFKFASLAIKSWVEQSLDGIKTAADTADLQVVHDQMSAAQAATDSKFQQLYYNNPRVGGVDQGGSTEEFNPLLNDLLKPNRTPALLGQE